MNVGDLIDNRYKLVSLLGRGTFGEVWKAKDILLNIDIAIKLYIRLDDSGRTLFRKEYLTMCEVRHENLVTPSFYGEWQDKPYLIMEYCPKCAADYIPGGNNRLNVRQLLLLIRGVARALDCMHLKGLVHQDVKPSNILLRRIDVFALSDFGVSSQLRNTLQTQVQNNLPGTLPYMAPEMFLPNAKVSPKIDIFALGVTIYEMVTGRVPFMNAAAMHRNGIPSIERFSDVLNKLMQKCLQIEPSKRPSAKDLHEQINKLLHT